MAGECAIVESSAGETPRRDSEGMSIMHTFDTCYTCAEYYRTKDLMVLQGRDKVYVPQAWDAIESSCQGTAMPIGTVTTSGECYVCCEDKNLRYWFTV